MVPDAGAAFRSPESGSARRPMKHPGPRILVLEYSREVRAGSGSAAFETAGGVGRLLSLEPRQTCSRRANQRPGTPTKATL